MTASTRIQLKKLPKFDEIEQNVIIYKRPTREIDLMECTCTRDMDCGTSECLNRRSQMECPEYCKVPNCTNKKLQKKDYPKLGACWTKGKGYGILADENISNGRLVNEYMGEVISLAEANRRSLQYKRSKERHHYIMGIGNGEAIDATKKGSLSRFINHSCEPNCIVEKWTVNRETRAGVFAIKDISEDDEITIDYAFEEFGSFLQTCLCGSKKCVGFIGGLSKKRRSNGKISQFVSSTISSLPKIPKKIVQSQLPKIEALEPVFSQAEYDATCDATCGESFANFGFQMNEQQARSNGKISQFVSSTISSLPKIPKKIVQSQLPKIEALEPVFSQAEYDVTCGESFANFGFQMNEQQATESAFQRKRIRVNEQQAAKNVCENKRIRLNRSETSQSYLSSSDISEVVQTKDVFVPYLQLEDLLVPPPPTFLFQRVHLITRSSELEDVLIPPYFSS